MQEKPKCSNIRIDLQIDKWEIEKAKPTHRTNLFFLKEQQTDRSGRDNRKNRQHLEKSK